ncbi:MAG: hypothetical protein H0X51_06250 [Parachlamydiaceae bacterium]|nr:hypothetical protein [Parachlamydiaceae bacterium]
MFVSNFLQTPYHCITRLHATLVANPRLLRLSKVALAALGAIAAFLINQAFCQNYFFCGVSLLVGFIGGPELDAAIDERLLRDFREHPNYMATVSAILCFIHPHLFLIASTSIYCLYMGSKFKTFIRLNAPPRHNQLPWQQTNGT